MAQELPQSPASANGRSNGSHNGCAVAQCLRSAARTKTSWGAGGEEFLVVLPFSDADACLHIGERFRKAIAAGSVLTHDGDVISVTVSVGCATGIDDDLV